MASYTRLFVINSTKFLYPRECLLNPCKFVTNKVMKRLEKTVFPSKPKKPPSPYILYTMDRIADIRAEFPNRENKVYLREMSKEWMTLSTEVKKKYQHKYCDMMVEYTKAKAEFEKSKTQEQIDQLKMLQMEHEMKLAKKESKQKNQLLGKPKKPPSAFLLFLHKQYLQKPPNSSRGWVKSQSALWNNMTEAEKLPYLEENSKILAQYAEDVKAWQKKMKDRGFDDVIDQNDEAINKQKEDVKNPKL